MADNLLEGHATRPQLKAMFKELMGREPCDRTIVRWEREGLEVARRGNLRIYDLAQARDWLLGKAPDRKRRSRTR